jgi:hypothetical protein
VEKLMPESVAARGVLAESVVLSATGSEAVVQESWVHPDGRLVGHLRVVEPAVVRVVAVDAMQRVALCRRFRHNVRTAGGWSLELPSVEVPVDTPAQDAAGRALATVGLRAASWIALGTADLVTGVANQRAHLYLAYQLRRTPVLPARTLVGQGLPGRGAAPSISELRVGGESYGRAVDLAVEGGLDAASCLALLRADRWRRRAGTDTGGPWSPRPGPPALAGMGLGHRLVDRTT